MALLRQRDFLLLFVGQGVSRLGDGLYTAVVVWLAWTLTHDPSAVALVTTAVYAPAFLATLIGASYADRYDRRRLMIATDLARAVVVALAPILLALGLLNLTLLATGVALLALIGAPFSPARNAIVPQVAPAGRLLEANSLLQISFRAAFFVGPLLLAPLLAVLSLEAVLALDVITFLTSAATLAAIRVRPAAQTGEPIGLGADLAAGFAALRAEPDVLIVITTFVLALVSASGFLTVGIVALVGDSFGGGSGEYGLLLGIAGVAEVFGALALARLPVRNLALTAVLAWGLLGAFRFPLGLAETPVVAALLLAVTGFASALTDIPLIALVQQRIPDRHLAKALGLWEAGIAGALAVAPFVAAATIEQVGVRSAFMLSGVALIVIAAVAAINITRVRAGPMPGRLTDGALDGNQVGTLATHIAFDIGGLTTMPRKDASHLFGQDHVRSYRETDGKVGHDWKGTSTLLITTIGRRSGELRTTPLIYGQRGDDYLVVASNDGSDIPPGWYFNLTERPEVTVQVRGDRFTARARTATADEKPELWQEMISRFAGYEDYQRKANREFPVVVLERQESNRAQGRG
jgi:deazaflavin-dependent oxidoreductase (nitroreductase family)